MCTASQSTRIRLFLQANKKVAFAVFLLLFSMQKIQDQTCYSILPSGISAILTAKLFTLSSDVKYMKITGGAGTGSENIDAVYFDCPKSFCFGVLITGGTNPSNSVGASDGISTDTGPTVELLP